MTRSDRVTIAVDGGNSKTDLALARGNGWNPVAVWKDADDLFSVQAFAFGG